MYYIWSNKWTVTFGIFDWHILKRVFQIIKQHKIIINWFTKLLKFRPKNWDILGLERSLLRAPT